MGLMLPSAPQFSLFESNISATPSNNALGTAVNHYVTTAHTKNTTCTQLIAATAFDAQLVIVYFYANNASNADSSTLTDIMIGASTEESVLLPDLMSGWVPSAPTSAGSMRHYIFPVYVPSGSRISARSQSVLTSGSVGVLIQLYGGPRHPDGWWFGHHVTAYGVNASTSAGVSWTPGLSGAETATPVAVGTTTAHHSAFVLGLQGDPADASWLARVGHVDVGIDTASTSWLVRDSYYFNASTAEAIGPAGALWWPVFGPTPSGSVIVVGGEVDTAAADPYTAAVYGIS